MSTVYIATREKYFLRCDDDRLLCRDDLISIVDELGSVHVMQFVLTDNPTASEVLQYAIRYHDPHWHVCNTNSQIVP
ncbi:hypothetical protein CEXT_359901 [Caerostris extrusa]|uniref:Uncharacterized protein n=1 Tax=Caerostris extrusa TaxID=172846 RepID=A0AAV4NEA2_CAEEX|nr:hypothetical protein CEXT_359901 [Caerostris extrusa]